MDESKRNPADESAQTSRDPEVLEKAKRRQFRDKYKLAILEEADCATEPGEVGAMLRREGLCSSHLTNWRKKRKEGALRALKPKKRGPKSRKNPLSDRVAKLERENRRLRERLETAEIIIDVQKKVAAMLGNPIDESELPKLESE